MNKLILSLLLTTVTNEVICMKRPHPQSLDEAMSAGRQDPNFEQNFLSTINNQRWNECSIMSITDEEYAQMLFQPLKKEVWRQLPCDLTKKILANHFTDTFTTKDTPATVKKHITTMSSLLNKEITAHVHSPQTTLIILRNICGTLHPRFLAEKINTPSMQNYLAKSNTLYLALMNNTLNLAQAQQLVLEGADPNYMLHYMPDNELPLLYWALDSYDNTKTLLELGADVNTTFIMDIWYPTTVLKIAISKSLITKNFNIVKLLLSYNPLNKHLHDVIVTQDKDLLELVLQSEFTPQQLLNSLNFLRGKDHLVYAIEPITLAYNELLQAREKA